MAKQIGGGSAKPLKIVARDVMTSDGGKEGTLTANPKVIDGVIIRAWQKIRNEDAGNIPELVRNFESKYTHKMYFKVMLLLEQLPAKQTVLSTLFYLIKTL